MSGFAITHGKGFRITFENGYTVSVQFGYSNYCDNYDNPQPIKNGYCTSTTAETAVLRSDGGFVSYKGDDVQGNQTPAEVLETLNYFASMK